MSGVYGYSQTAASNTSADGVSTAEGMNPGLVNNAMRGMMAETAQWRDDISGAITSGGSANAQTLTTNSTISAYADGQMFSFVAGFTNTSTATLNVDGVGAKAIRRQDDQALVGGELLAGGHYIVQYDASANSAAGAWLLLTPSLGSAAFKNTGTSGDAVPLLNAANTFVSGQSISAAGQTYLVLSDTGTQNWYIVSETGDLTLRHTSLAGSNIVFTIDTSGTVNVPSGGSFTVNGGGQTGVNGATIADGGRTFSRNGTGTQTQLSLVNGNGVVGSITTNGTSTAFNTSSDKDLKENWVEFDSGSILDALEVWKFDWKTGGTGYGVLAQDAYEVFPDAISPGSEEDPIWRADYSKYVPLLLSEVKKLRQRISDLESA